ncbi:MAG: glycosyltransferase, partial [Acidobacteriaceae bacterium]
MSISISICIITLNEEANLPRTLASVRWADEIIVVDSGSTDRTCEIAREYGAKVYIG